MFAKLLSLKNGSYVQANEKLQLLFINNTIYDKHIYTYTYINDYVVAGHYIDIVKIRFII